MALLSIVILFSAPHSSAFIVCVCMCVLEGIEEATLILRSTTHDDFAVLSFHWPSLFRSVKCQINSLYSGTSHEHSFWKQNSLLLSVKHTPTHTDTHTQCFHVSSVSQLSVLLYVNINWQLWLNSPGNTTLLSLATPVHRFPTPDQNFHVSSPSGNLLQLVWEQL